MLRHTLFDVSGTWKHHDAHRIIKEHEPSYKKFGMCLQLIDVSTHNEPNIVLIQVMCAIHDMPVQVDSACPLCVEFK